MRLDPQTPNASKLETTQILFCSHTARVLVSCHMLRCYYGTRNHVRRQSTNPISQASTAACDDGASKKNTLDKGPHLGFTTCRRATLASPSSMPAEPFVQG